MAELVKPKDHKPIYYNNGALKPKIDWNAILKFDFCLVLIVKYEQRQIEY